MMKAVKSIVKLLIKAGEATPAPPIGPSLAQHGINIAEFCSKFNEITKDKKGEILPAIITIYEDRSFDFVIKKPPVSELIKKFAKIEKGSKEAGRITAATIRVEDVRKIAEEKMEDLNTDNIENVVKIVTGTAKSMGVEVE
jgi:large subunit ribosomal protein L11